MPQHRTCFFLGTRGRLVSKQPCFLRLDCSRWTGSPRRWVSRVIDLSRYRLCNQLPSNLRRTAWGWLCLWIGCCRGFCLRTHATDWFLQVNDISVHSVPKLLYYIYDWSATHEAINRTLTGENKLKKFIISKSLFLSGYSFPSGDSCSFIMCLLSWPLFAKGLPHISQVTLLGSIPRSGSSCSGGALGRVGLFLICLLWADFFSIKNTTRIRRVC